MVPTSPVKIFLKRFRLCLNVKNSDKLDNEKPDFESLARTSKLGLTIKIRWNLSDKNLVYFFRMHPKSVRQNSRKELS